jgi:hypothetical protein
VTSTTHGPLQLLIQGIKCCRPLTGYVPISPFPIRIYDVVSRQEIANRLGVPWRKRKWEQGIVRVDGLILIFVTFEKAGMPAEHRYEDRLVPPDLLVWKSRHRDAPEGKTGRAILDREATAVPAHFFARKQGRLMGRTVPFVYSGKLNPVYYHGRLPITVIWRIEPPLPDEIVMEIVGGPPKRIWPDL